MGKFMKETGGMEKSMAEERRFFPTEMFMRENTTTASDKGKDFTVGTKVLDLIKVNLTKICAMGSVE